MASYPLYNFAHGYYANEENDIIKIYDLNQNLSYIGIKFNGDIHMLHNEFRTLFPNHCNYLPEVQCPYYFNNTSAIVMPTKCLKPESLFQLPASWYFESERVYDTQIREFVQNRLYATISFKYVLFSILRNVKLFESRNIRPVLDLSKMFLTQNGGVIFSEYEIRGHGHNDLNDVLSLINTILANYGNTSTLILEFGDLSNWLRRYWNDPRTKISDVLALVVFWTRDMRIQYIFLLWNFLRSPKTYNGNRPNYIIQRYAARAFADHHGNCHWYNSLNNCQHPILWNICRDGNRYFNYFGNSNAPKCMFRTSNVEGQNDTFVLCCGLTRMRDAFEHIEATARSMVPIFQNITPLQLQSSYQDYFPRHMLEFAKVQHYVIDFKAKKRVKELLRDYQYEDVSLANLAIN